MSYGMTYDEYWRGDTMMALAFKRKYDIDRENRNAEMWLQGLYNYEAFGVVLSNSFKKKGATAAQYAKEPYRITPLTPEEKKAKREAELKKIYANFDNMIAAQRAKETPDGNQD